MALPKGFRLRRSVDVRRVLSEGRTRAGSLTVFYWIHRNAVDGDAEPRAAIITSRRLGKATVRNRVRRRVSEIMGQELGKLRRPTDIVVIVRRRGVLAGFDELREEIRYLLRRIDLDNGSV